MTPVEPTDADIQTMVDAYLECALWCSIPIDRAESLPCLDRRWRAEDGDDRSFLDHGHNVFSFSFAACDVAETECVAFLLDHPEALLDPAEAGHCLWLTRNGHGGGFGDMRGPWTEAQEDRMGDSARMMGERYVDVDGNDDLTILR